MALQQPEGTKDLLPEEAGFWEHFKNVAYSTFGCYGYVPIETPVFEQTELFVRGIGEATDVVSKEMFQAISGENMAKLCAGESIKAKSRLSLRPEGTAGVVRAVVQHDLVPQGAHPVKLMYAGQMFRAERPQKGRQRQFNQIGVECLGADAPSLDAEVIIMLMRFFERIGIPPEKTTLLVNSMGCEQCRPHYRDLVRRYMEEHAAELCEDCLVRMDTNPLRAFDCKKPGCSAVMDGAPKITDHLCSDCSAHYAEVKAMLERASVAFCEDPRLVRGLDYYTRTVFEAQVNEGLGSQNAIGGGGRYDKLAEEIGGRPTHGIGFALGYERCKLALEAAGKDTASHYACDVFITCVDSSVRAPAFELMQFLRDEDVICETDHQGRSIKSQFKLASKLDAGFVITFGPDEWSRGQVRVKKMSTGCEVLRDYKMLIAYIERQIEGVRMIGRENSAVLALDALIEMADETED